MLENKDAAKVSFYSQLKEEVYTFIDKNSLIPQGNKLIYVKAISILLAWLAAYAGFIVAVSFSAYLIASLCLFTACFFMLAMQMGIMHDASHKSFGNKKSVNGILSQCLAIAGASATLWYHKHVVSHHSNPNIPGSDPDIESGGIFRFNSTDDWKWYHRFQHWYAVPAYSLLVLKWVWVDDVKELVHNRYKIRGKDRTKAWVEIVFSRVIHMAIYIILPLAVGLNPWLVLTFYLAHWMVLGAVLSLIFSLAHVNTVQDFPESKDGFENDWALLQLATTANFATGNKFLTWFIGGLNYQVEHHLFPRISHQLYPQIRKIVREYCSKHNVEYLEYSTFKEALFDHFDHLRILSARPA
ncbi:MAG: acyl-CoA desaturase [Lentisphaeria bacterium]|nr:acyl-CoA desaturase [Lentisphaeria bacterium]NQZ66430.1 acyl-CoA desaturase [Lentisphaeria bacterium]